MPVMECRLILLSKSNINAPKQRFRFVFGLTLFATLATGAAVFFILLNTALKQNSEHLQSQVEDRRALISAVAAFTSLNNADYIGGSRAATLSQLSAAQNNHTHYSLSREFTVAEIKDGQIHFIFRQFRGGFDHPAPVPLASDLAEPMRRALRGETGVIQALDYSGEKVLAAYTPVPGLGIGLVAKVDLKEMYAPYILGAGAAFLVIILIFSICSLVISRLTSPLNIRMTEDERLVKNLIGGRTDFVLHSDMAGRVTYINDAYSHFLGTQNEALIDKSLDDIYTPDNFASLSEVCRHLSSENTSVRHVLQEDTHDGIERWIEWTIKREQDDDTNRWRLVSIGSDITERKVEENSRRALQRLVENSPVILFLWKNSDSWPVEFVSKNVSKLGYSIEQFLSGEVKYLDIIHPDDRERVRKEVAEYSAASFENFHQEYRIKAANGDYRFIDDLTWIRRDRDGEITHYQGVLQDVTENKEMRANVERSIQTRKALLRAQNILLNANNEDDMWHDVLNALVEEQDYPLAWIGTPALDGSFAITPLAASGTAVSYLDDITVRWSDDACGQGPTGHAYRSQSIEVATADKDALTTAPWFEKAKKEGFGSVAAVPIMSGTDVAFVLSVYSLEVDGFDDFETNFLTELAGVLSITIQSIRAMQESGRMHQELGSAALGAINAIAATIEKRDPYTAGHQDRVSELAVAIAKKLHWEPFRIEGLRLGAIIHDIGKISAPAEILNRPGKLSDAEFEIVKAHPVTGAEIISHAHFPWPIQEMIIQHHERIDGSGYPLGLTGADIIEEAKVIAVADVVEAITAHRPYRPALGLEAGIAELQRGKGTAYDPDIVDICVELITENDFDWGVS